MWNIAFCQSKRREETKEKEMNLHTISNSQTQSMLCHWIEQCLFWEEIHNNGILIHSGKEVKKKKKKTDEQL